MLVIGDREAEAGTVAVRLRTEEDLGARPVEEFIALAQEAIAEKRVN
jgi:threonyl-tRNA synthetase